METWTKSRGPLVAKSDPHPSKIILGASTKHRKQASRIVVPICSSPSLSA